MAHHTLARDPPDSSFRDADARNLFATRAEQEPTPAHAPGAHNAQGSKNRMPPRATNSSENTASRASRSRLEFHKTAHSFPDYGSVKGAVRMRLPGLLKAIAPQTHINTLDSGPSVPPGPLQTPNTFQPTDEAPPPKRQKIRSDTRRRSPIEDITDIDQDAVSWTERHGSQTSLAHSVSPGIPEYQVVQESTKGTGRSHRRSRRPQTNHPSAMPAMTSQASRVRISRQDPIADDFDVLIPAQKPALREQRTARLISVNATRDPADACILSKPTRPGLSPRSKKRLNHEIVDDQDELAGGTSGREPPAASERQAIEGSPKNKSPSLSRRGDMKSTKWADNRGDHIPPGVDVIAAVCQPNFRFVASNGQNNCFLRPTDGAELRVFTHESLPAEPYQWLKITGKANTLFYHPDSNLIKLNQSMDQTSIRIGGLMVIKLRSNADALWVVDWVREHLTVRVALEEEKNKLASSYEKLHTDVAHSRSQASNRRLPDGTPVRLTQANEASPRANAALTESAPASSRTPIRHQMQVSAQHTETPLPPFGTASEHAPVASRSLRTRDIFQQGPTLGTPRVSTVRRWSDENRDWAQGWDMPLIRRRTTVDKEDIPRLDEGQCLNDNLIGYGLRYLFDVFGARNKDLHKRVYLHNSFFYEKLKAGRGAINYDGVKNWTTKVDLLSFDYIIVPVNEHYHWWVAIICNPGKLDPASRRASGDTRDPAQVMEGKVNGAASDVEMTGVTEKRPPRSPRDKTDMVKSDLVDLVSDDKNVSIDLTSTFRAKQTKKAKAGARTYSPDDPRIITLDSLGSTHPQAISHLRKYLLAEFEDKRKTVITDPPTTLGMKAVNIPEQNNLCDCGVYLLGYIQEFVKDPDQFIRTLLQKESPDWKFDPSDLRNLWRETIFEERKQHLKPQRGLKPKLEASAATSPPKSSVEPSRHPSRDNSTEDTKDTDTLNGKLGNETNSSGHFVPNSNSGSPMNVDTPQVDGPSTEPTRCATQPTRTSGSEQPQVSEMVRAPLSPRPPVSQQDNLDEAIVPIPTVEGDPVFLTIEAPDAEELPGPPSPSRNDPLLLSPLSSTSPSGPAEDGETTAEVLPASFHSPNTAKSRARQGRPAPSSPASVRRRRAAKARPKHTTSHFVVDEGPIVMSADLVRNSDPIDLTDD